MLNHAFSTLVFMCVNVYACLYMLCQMPSVATQDDCGASAQHNLNQQQDKTHLNPTEFLCKEAG